MQQCHGNWSLVLGLSRICVPLGRLKISRLTFKKKMEIKTIGGGLLVSHSTWLFHLRIPLSRRLHSVF